MILTLTGADLKTAFLNGFSPVCNPGINTGRFPQVSGLKATFHCSSTTAGRGRDLEDAERSGRDGDPGRSDGHGSVRHERLHVHGR